MNLATGSLIFLGAMFIVLGAASKVLELSLLGCIFPTCLGYFVGANTCFILALILDKFQDR